MDTNNNTDEKLGQPSFKEALEIYRGSSKTYSRDYQTLMLNVMGMFNLCLAIGVIYVVLDWGNPLNFMFFLWPALIFVFGLVTKAIYKEKSLWMPITFANIMACIGWPLIWIFSGGFSPISFVWYVFLWFFTVSSSRPGEKSIFIHIGAAEGVALFLLTYFFPSIILRQEPGNAKLLAFITAFLVGGAIKPIIEAMNRVLLYERKTNAELNAEIASNQEELLAQNEELVATNDELVALTHKLDQANINQKRSTAFLNHELRTPLNGIMGCLQILNASDEISPSDKEIAEQAIGACKNMTLTVNDMLDFGKMEEGKFEIVEVEYDLKKVLDNTHAIFEPLAQSKGLDFEMQIPQDTKCGLVGDGVRVQQILNNIISNAIKYTNRGCVTVGISTTEDILKFVVTDTGQGMSKESIAVLFDPYSRFNSKENINIQGTGLGMSIVHNLITQMQGSINVESAVNVGSQFTVTLPLKMYDPQLIYSSERKAVSETLGNVSFEGKNILYVDDTALNLSVLKGMLKKNKANITTTRSPFDGEKLCYKNKYDIILLDHMMPDKSGIDIYSQIRGDKNCINTDTPVIIFTGNADKESADLYRSIGVNGYLIKPVIREELLHMLSNILKGSE